MIIFRFDSELLKIVVTIIEVAVIVWAVRRAKINYEQRKDIVEDGWITRWSDDPDAYRKEHRQFVRRGYEEMVLIVFFAASQIFLWSAL